MKIWMKANVSWVLYENGGRKKQLPSGTRYCPIIVFPQARTKDTWSAEIIVGDVSNGEAIVDISFLFPNAPFELLKPGEEFELYEGKAKVADGVLIEKISK